MSLLLLFRPQLVDDGEVPPPPRGHLRYAVPPRHAELAPQRRSEEDEELLVLLPTHRPNPLTPH